MFKKYVLVISMLLLFPAGVFAGNVGGLADQMGGQLLTVTTYIGVVDRDVKIGALDEDFTSRVFGVKASYGLNDRVDVYATIGLADIQDLGPYDCALGNMVGGGGKFLIIEGANGTRLTLNGDARILRTDDGAIDVEYREISAALIVSKKVGNLTPFGGVKLSEVDIDIDQDKDAEEEKGTGLFAGVDYFVNPNVYFTGEIHVFAENTLYAGVGYNF